MDRKLQTGKAAANASASSIGRGRARRLRRKAMVTPTRRPRMNRPPGFEEVGKAPAWERLQTAITPTARSPGISSGASTTDPSSRLPFREAAARACGRRLIRNRGPRRESARNHVNGAALLTSVPEHGQDGHQHDLEVEPERPVL